MSKPIPPFFAGQQLFGDLDSFQQVNLQLGTVAEIDAFLGLTPGTTVYPADFGGGHLYAVTGILKGPTTDAVNAQLETLQSYIGIVSTYRRPTADLFPSTVQIVHNCYFTSGDLTFGSVTQLGVNNYGQTYALVIRQKAIVG